MILLAAACLALMGDPPRIDQRVGETVTLDAAFVDETGAALTLRRAADSKPVILALVYYRCPMLCTLELNGLLQSLQELSLSAGEAFTVIAVSFDPREGPDLARGKKAQVVKSYGRPAAERGWRFLTGGAEAVERLCRETGFRATLDPATGLYGHGSAMILLTPDGRISRYLFGVTYPVRELRLSLVEASAGTIGTATDQFLLLCLQYDPATGRYGPAVTRILQAFAVATVLALGLLIRRLSRRRVGKA